MNKTLTSGIEVTFKTTDGRVYKSSGKEGDTLYEVVTGKKIPLDGYGSCKGRIICCTCHVVLNKEHFDQLPKACDEENDRLDFAHGLSDTSRLGCQVILTKQMNGMEVLVPAAECWYHPQSKLDSLA